VFSQGSCKPSRALLLISKWLPPKVAQGELRRDWGDREGPNAHPATLTHDHPVFGKTHEVSRWYEA
jgi:hypothetical protein